MLSDTFKSRPPSAGAGALALAAVCLAACAAEAADWPQWLGPERSGVTPEAVPSWPPKKLWSASVGTGYTSPVIAAGRVYLLGHEKSATVSARGTDTVWCLDAAKGSVVWKHSYDCLTERRDKTAGYPGPRATPAVAGGAVYTLSLEGLLLCLDASTGEVRWSKDLPKEIGAEVPFYGYCGSPVVHDGKVIVEANIPKGGCYAAFDAKTGSLVWKTGDASASTASPVVAHIDGKSVALFISDNVLAGHDTGTGQELWRVKLDWTTWMGPVVWGDKIFASSASLARGCALYQFGRPEPLWKDRTRYQALHCNSAVRNGHLYGSDNTRTDYQYEDGSRSSLKCIDLASGQAVWTLKGLGWANVVMAGDKLLLLREEGELVLMDVSPAGHSELGRAKVIDGPCWTVPALSGGRIYCRNNKGDVVCCDVGAR